LNNRGKNIMKRFVLLLAVISAVTASAEVPMAYYRGLDGKSESELKTAAYNIIRNLTPISDYYDLPDYFEVTDVYPNSRRWWDMYSDIPLYAPSFKGLNREHSLPKSWWGGLTNVQAYTDLNHLYPSESAANMAKSNYPLGMVDRTSPTKFNNGVTTVGYPVAGQGGGAGYVFEPDDEYKGDFARTYFYMATCYQDYTWKYKYMLVNGTYPTLNQWSVDLLLKWHREDQVSQKEIDRNEAVYKFQNNRNPFIDFPELAEYIWGNRKGQIFKLDETTQPAGDPVLITPVQDMALEFGQVALGKSVTAKMFFRGENLKSDIRVQVYQGNKELFTIPVKTIAYRNVNSSDGYWLNVTYTPTAVGTHTSRLLISGGGIDGSRGVELRGECLPVPTLTPCTATAPTDMTSTSYVANWTAPEGETIDYYVVTRTKYVGGNATTEEDIAEDTSLQIDGFDESDRESYYVQSVRLGYRSEPSNVIFVDHLGITGVDTDAPLAVVALEGAVRIICAAPQTGCRIFDVAGRLVTEVPVVSNNTDIPLPLGVYLVTTDQSRRPLKVSVR